MKIQHGMLAGVGDWKSDKHDGNWKVRGGVGGITRRAEKNFSRSKRSTNTAALCYDVLGCYLRFYFTVTTMVSIVS